MPIRLDPATEATVLRAVAAASPVAMRAAAADAVRAAMVRMPPGRGPFYATLELIGEGGNVVASGKQRVTKLGKLVGKPPVLRPTVTGWVTGARLRMPSGATVTESVAWDTAPPWIGGLRLKRL